MLGRLPFKHLILRKYQMVIGAMFNQLWVTREDKSGNTIKQIKVPLSYAPKEKVLARVTGDPTANRSYGALLPRISFEMTSLSYSADRALRSTRKSAIWVREGDPDNLDTMLQPVPYDIKFTVWVFSKYQEDGNQLVEQILPFFTPHFQATVNLIEEINVDCEVRLDSVSVQDVYSGSFLERQAVMWTLELTLTGWLFGPVTQHPIIKFANASLYATDGLTVDQMVGNSSPIDRVTVQPGQDANGDPTTNVAISVDYHEVEANSSWDYAVTISGSLVPGDMSR